MGSYYYDGKAYHSPDHLLADVRRDLDFSFGDSDLNSFLRGNGGVEVDGEECLTSLSLKRHSPEAYNNIRNAVIDDIISEIKDSIEFGFFPIQVPFTCNLIECSE